MRRFFIDCGGYDGESVIAARVRWGDVFTAIHSFEPNPELWSYYKDLPTVLHKQAVWIYDGEMNFYVAENPLSSGIHKDRVQKLHGSPVIITKEIKTPCIDFSQWLLNNFTKDDYIILKMNVEGAEYEIFDKMFKDGSIYLINEIWGDLHRRQFPQMTRKNDLGVIEKLKSIGLQFNTWSIQKCEKTMPNV